MTGVITESSELFSTLASDPDMVELVEMFVDELPGRIAALQAAWDAADLEALARGAHQLKGAAGSYGFDMLTPAFKRLEQTVRDHGVEEEIRLHLSEVTELCRRVRSGSPLALR
jgi:HPt (histidine-containing phosphotransfer) domain-containing protein